MFTNTAQAGPAISVIMPVYNGQEYLREAIDSILGQSFADFELILINDGSTDQTQAIIDSYLDPRIKVLRNPKNLGVVGALNVGLSAARGKYWARQDQDDRSHLDRFLLQFHAMEKESFDICGTGWITMNPQGALLKAQQNPSNAQSIFACLATNVPFPHGSVMMRASFLKDHQLQYDDTQYFGDDYWLWVRMIQAGARFANLPENLYFYRVHPQSISFVKKNLFIKTAKRLRRDFVKHNQADALKALNELTKTPQTIAALNERETIYAALLAYRLSLSWNSVGQWMKIFWRASAKLKLHIIYTMIRS